MSTKAIWPARPRSSSTKIRLKNSSASSIPPTSIATWLIPTSFDIFSFNAGQAFVNPDHLTLYGEIR